MTRITLPHGITKAQMHWGILHVALVFFGLDMIAAVFPAFDHFWNAEGRGVGHSCVAVAAFLATMADVWFKDEHPSKEANA